MSQTNINLNSQSKIYAFYPYQQQHNSTLNKANLSNNVKYTNNYVRLIPGTRNNTKKQRSFSMKNLNVSEYNNISYRNEHTKKTLYKNNSKSNKSNNKSNNNNGSKLSLFHLQKPAGNRSILSRTNHGKNIEIYHPQFSQKNVYNNMYNCSGNNGYLSSLNKKNYNKIKYDNLNNKKNTRNLSTRNKSIFNDYSDNNFSLNDNGRSSLNNVSKIVGKKTRNKNRNGDFYKKNSDKNESKSINVKSVTLRMSDLSLNERKISVFRENNKANEGSKAEKVNNNTIIILNNNLYSGHNNNNSNNNNNNNCLQHSNSVYTNIKLSNNFYVRLLPSSFIINYSDLKYNKSDIIHYSEDSILYKGKYLSTEVCIKEFKGTDRLSKQELDKIINEISLNFSVHHPNIVVPMGICLNQNKVYLITEFLPNKNLKFYIEKCSKSSIVIPIKKKLKFIYEIALAIAYLHNRSPKIYHRDLKTSNVLLDEHFRCKLCDFGMSKYKEEFPYKTNSQSTLYWMSPEYLCKGIFTEKSDIYSLSILIWEIFMQDTVPYKDINNFDYMLGNEEVIYKNRPVIDPNKFKVCPEMQRLIEKMWDNDPERRPFITEVVEFVEELMHNYKE